MESRKALSLWYTCLSLQSAGITEMCSHAWLSSFLLDSNSTLLINATADFPESLSSLLVIHAFF